MCGRFSRKAILQAIIDEFEIEEVNTTLEPRYNIAPGQEIAVVTDGGNNKLLSFKWGLIPSWSKDPSIGNRMINARAETIAEKPSFKHPLRKKRCLIVADGFYEWRKDGKQKIPVYVTLKSERPFGFAGLWDTWESPEGEKISTCTIITTEPNELLKKIHNRMPVILPKNYYHIWLDRDMQDEKELVGLLKPYSASEMRAYEVSRLVNSPKNDSPECIKPLK